MYIRKVVGRTGWNQTGVHVIGRQAPLLQTELTGQPPTLMHIQRFVQNCQCLVLIMTLMTYMYSERMPINLKPIFTKETI